MTTDSITCPECNEPLPARMRFCGYCGARLPEAAVAVPPALQYPHHPRSAVDRRLVTVLFCDLVGYTPLSESLDPEDLREIQEAYFEAMDAEIDRYGGIAQKYAGDAVLAVFGAPVAHEDDAERAVRCGLAMLDALRGISVPVLDSGKPALQLRVGVNTGEVVSGLRGTGNHTDYTLTGDTVNTAARFQTAAEPGEVLVGEGTMQLARRSILFGERRDLVLKGKADIVPGYLALGVRDQPLERWEFSPIRAPLIGRDVEMQLILHAWHAADAGNGRLIAIVAEAGMGKSRLTVEVIERIAASGGARVARARCLGYAQNVSLFLLADLVRSILGIGPHDSPDEVRDSVDIGLVSLFAEDESETYEISADVIGEMLGLPPGASALAHADARARHMALVRALHLMLSSASAETPLLISLEDLHWIDPASADVLAELLPRISALPVLVIVTHRPEWDAPWTAEPWASTIRLEPLAEEDIPTLAQALLHSVPVSDELARTLTDRTDGNPYFIEELLRSLQESGSLREEKGQAVLAPGAAEILPSTLTEVLLARLDGIGAQAHLAAQVGSVIGRQFPLRLIAAVSGETEAELLGALEELEHAGLVLPDPDRPLDYSFKHVMVQEVAYNTVLHKRRAQLHAAVARALNQLAPGEEQVETIAYHFEKSEEHAEATHWLEQAGDRAEAVFAHDEAALHYAKALDRARQARIEERAGFLLGKLGGVYFAQGRIDESLRTLDEAARAHAAIDDFDGEMGVLARLGWTLYEQGRRQEGIDRLTAALERWRSDPTESSNAASLLVSMASLLWANGRFDEALPLADTAVQVARTVGNRRLQGDAHGRRGVLLNALGRGDEALAAYAEAILLAETSNDLANLTRTLTNRSLIYGNRGELELRRLDLERALEVARRMDSPTHIAWTLLYAGQVAFDAGEWDRAQTLLREAIETLGGLRATRAFAVAELAGFTMLMDDPEGGVAELERLTGPDSPHDQIYLRAQRWLALWDLLQGRPADARMRLERVLANPGLERQLRSESRWLLAAALQAIGEIDAAEAMAAEHLSTMTRSRDLADWWPIMGMVRAAQGRIAESAEAFEQGLTHSRRCGNRFGEAVTLLQFGQMHLATGDAERALELLKQALTLFQRLQSSIYIAQTESVLAHLPASPPAGLAHNPVA